MNCSRSTKPIDLHTIEIVSLAAQNPTKDYMEALSMAREEADRRFEEHMLVSWYDRDRDFESPPHTTEKPGNGPKDGYIHYGINHGAKLKVDVDDGRFVFFFAPVDW